MTYLLMFWGTRPRVSVALLCAFELRLDGSFGHHRLTRIGSDGRRQRMWENSQAGSGGSGHLIRPQLIAPVDQEHRHPVVPSTDIDRGTTPVRPLPSGGGERHGRDDHNAVHFLGEAFEPSCHIAG